jgi:purine catabolism regulator
MAMWRTFNVGAVVECLPFVGAQVAAGADGTSRTVTRARLATTPEDLRRAEATELVVTTAEALGAVGAEPETLVDGLIAAGVAGLAVRLGSDGELSRSLLQAADGRSLPVITFPDDAQLTDVTAVILDALLAAQRQRLDRFLDTHQRFTRIMMAGGGIPEIASALHELLSCPVAVVDTEDQATVIVPPGATATVDIESGIRQPIGAGDDLYGNVVVFPASATLDQDDNVALERAATAVAVHLAQASAVANAEERFAAVSLEELIAGHATANDVAGRAVSFGWDLNRPRAVLLASVDPPEHGSIPDSALYSIAAAARATLGPDAIVWTRTATIAALLAPDTADPTERRDIAERLRQELDERVRSVTISIGVGRRVDSPAELPRSFVEASRAVHVGRWAKGRHVTEVFDQLGLERLLSATPTEDLTEFVQQAIGPLVTHDRDHQSGLVETLTAWLETRNMAESARRLHVHYNTLKNRMERIEAIIGPVLNDAAHALECEVAIYVDRHYDVPWDHVR